MKNVKSVFFFLFVTIFSTLLIGCKLGGLMENDKDSPLKVATFKGESTELTAGFPFEMSTNSQREEIPEDAKGFVTTIQRFQGNSQDMVVNVISTNYKKELFVKMSEKERMEGIKEIVDDDMKAMRKQNSIQDFQENRQETTIHGNPAIIAIVRYKNAGTSMEGRCMYIIKQNETWVVICEYKASDSTMRNKAEEVQKSIRIKE